MKKATATDKGNNWQSRRDVMAVNRNESKRKMTDRNVYCWLLAEFARLRKDRWAKQLR